MLIYKQTNFPSVSFFISLAHFPNTPVLEAHYIKINTVFYCIICLKPKLRRTQFHFICQTHLRKWVELFPERLQYHMAEKLYI